VFERFDFSVGPRTEFVVPAWYAQRSAPSDEALKYMQWQADLARAGEPHHVPEWSMRHPANEVHQLMAKEFWAEVPKDFDSILDVGCSDGYMVEVFQVAGKKAIGLNNQQLPIDRAYAEMNHLDVREGDMHNLPFRDASLDAVWCRHTLEHAFAPMQVLAEFHRVLKPEGYLFAVLPPPPMRPEPYPDHWHQIPEYQFRYLLEACNFRILSLESRFFSHKLENDNLEIRAVCRRARTA
jgi:SAM-dependent methyltransferase